uniref:Uncharacterized protein n=1 Tax=Oryza barthii TaxID=65489 RepID=A0A0D3FA59_9ORYZ
MVVSGDGCGHGSRPVRLVVLLEPGGGGWRCDGTAEARGEDADGSWFSIYVQNIHKGIHGSDTGAFDSEGRFVSEKFNEIFTRHAKTVPDGLTSDELDEMLHAYADHTEHKDSSGWLQAATEWRATFEAAKDKDDILQSRLRRELLQ